MWTFICVLMHNIVIKNWKKKDRNTDTVLNYSPDTVIYLQIWRWQGCYVLSRLVWMGRSSQGDDEDIYVLFTLSNAANILFAVSGWYIKTVQVLLGGYHFIHTLNLISVPYSLDGLTDVCDVVSAEWHEMMHSYFMTCKFACKEVVFQGAYKQHIVI